MKKEEARGGGGEGSPGPHIGTKTLVFVPEGGLKGKRRLQGVAGLDLADEVERRRKRFAAFFPGCRADLAGVGADILCGLDLAGEFIGIAADAFAGLFHDLDDTVRIDDEGRTIGEADAFELDACSWLLMHGEAQVWQQIAFFQTQLCGRSFLPAVE